MMNLEIFEKGTGIYLCCHNYSCYDNTVGRGGKAAVGGYWGVVIMPCLMRTSVHWMEWMHLAANGDE